MSESYTPAKVHVANLRRSAFRFGPEAFSFLLLAMMFPLGACRRLQPVDTAPLDHSGMSYDAIKQLKALKITPLEVSELVKARQGGLSDAGCIQIFQAYRGRGYSFDAGDSAAGLVQAGVSTDTVVQLANLNQLGVGAGELEAMRLAGLSDAIVLEVAQHHALSGPVLAGVSLARLSNSGLRESTLLELAHRGVPDSRIEAIIALRHHGATDEEILRRFPGS
jgi:hypothetical protein